MAYKYVTETARRREFRVSVVVPEDVTDEDMKEYIAEAVGTWKGQMHPDEPLYELDYKTIKVTRINKKRRKRDATVS